MKKKYFLMFEMKKRRKKCHQYYKNNENLMTYTCNALEIYPKKTSKLDIPSYSDVLLRLMRKRNCRHLCINVKGSPACAPCAQYNIPRGHWQDAASLPNEIYF